jgi:GDPmannose 4,6-dehydratase
MKTALITGITGQDGAYLAELLLAKGYRVIGLKRRASLFNTARIDHLFSPERNSGKQFDYSYVDLTDSSNLIRLIKEFEPDEIYNLAAQSHVKVSFDSPEYTANADGLGTLRLLEGIRILGLEQKPASIKHPLQSCLERCKAFRKMRKLPFTHALPTPWLSSMPIG